MQKPPKSVTNPTFAKITAPNSEVASVVDYQSGMRVEVKSGQEDYEGIWFPATILGPVCHGKYLVEFLTLRTDDGTKLLKEQVDARLIRPCLRVTQRVERFKPLEAVDAWYGGGGWWVGQVYKVFEGSKYAIYFRSTNEVLEFQHSFLRPHLDWRSGRWTSPTRD